MTATVLFPVYAIEETWNDVATLNADLKEKLLEIERFEKGEERSNAGGGWHSPDNVLQRPGECFRDLHVRLNRVCQTMTNRYGAKQHITYQQDVTAWSIITRDRGYNYPHTHPMSMWSGVYYVSPGKPSKKNPYNGYLEFIDPHMGASMIWCESLETNRRHYFKPVAGKVVVFPAWLPHFVHPFDGKGERVVVAFNCFVGHAPKDQQKGK